MMLYTFHTFGMFKNPLGMAAARGKSRSGSFKYAKAVINLFYAARCVNHES
jgi:hypothetical protein